MDERFDWGEAEADFLRTYPHRNAAQLDRDGFLARGGVEHVDRETLWEDQALDVLREMGRTRLAREEREEYGL